eukprot:SAG11_NODE_5198_length_1633_cov_1.166884_3_plen_229_part_00
MHLSLHALSSLLLITAPQLLRAGESGAQAPAPADYAALSVKELSRFLKQRGTRCHGCTDKSEYAARAAEVSELPPLYLPEKEAEAAGWGRGADAIAHLDSATADSFWESHAADGLLLLFHGWGCKAAKPAFARLTTELPHRVGAVDCGDAAAKPLCRAYGISEYPQVALAKPTTAVPPAALGSSLVLYDHSDPSSPTAHRAPFIVPLVRKWAKRQIDPTCVASPWPSG